MLVKIVDPSQVSFIPNRNVNIAENMLLAQEVVHTFTHSKEEEVKMGLKLDFRKAYNWMEFYIKESAW